MSGAYSQLLEATVVYLELLKQKGVRYVDVSPELVKTLVESASREGSIIKGNKQVQSQTVIQSSRADGPSVYDSPRLSSVDKSSAMDQLRE